MYLTLNADESVLHCMKRSTRILSHKSSLVKVLRTATNYPKNYYGE
jgi:hypothetical protein